ncbi:MAG TPA: hypothetical protein ENG83_15045 [Nitrospirae bacterium]|nr:SWIM zinc finger protein [bacterium BMS3Abin06]HDH13485.1 hypothetical protein [Nitrospirota bacterium]HDZ01075.1 hypothetical protein [Nitrospirota bacterium]
MKLKALTKKSIEGFAGSVIYQRGYDYFKSGMVYDLEYNQDEDSIYAQVSGNSGNYEVEAAAEKDGINASCDCPYDGYPCKHVAAALLKFIHNSDEYISEVKKQKKEVSSLKDRLKELPKDELLKMIITCADKYPDFKRDLMVRFESDKEAVLKAIRKQVDNVFPSIESRSYSTSTAVRQFRVILKSVQDASDAMKAEVNWMVADRILNELNEYGMSDESLENFVFDAFDGVADSLTGNKSLKGLREEIIKELMDYYTWGNSGMTDAIYETVEELCSDKSDYQVVIDKLEPLSRGKGHHTSYYKDLLADLYEMTGDEETKLKTLERDLEYGMDYWRLAEHWIDKGDSSKALEIVKDGIKKGEGRKDELYAYLLQHYEKQNDYGQILHLLKMKIEENGQAYFRGLNNDKIYQSLKKHYKSRNDYEGQADLLEMRLNCKDADLDLYKEAGKTLKKEDRDVFEKKMLDQLRNAKGGKRSYRGWAGNYGDEGLLAEIYNYKKDMKNLYDTVKNNFELLVKYEKQLAPLYPDSYLKTYRRKIKELVEYRGRENYITAAAYAKSVKKIYRTILKQPEEWDTYISMLRGANKTLRALQEELRGL